MGPLAFRSEARKMFEARHDSLSYVRTTRQRYKANSMAVSLLHGYLRHGCRCKEDVNRGLWLFAAAGNQKVDRVRLIRVAEVVLLR